MYMYMLARCRSFAMVLIHSLVDLSNFVFEDCGELLVSRDGGIIIITITHANARTYMY
jgi:hypothetical protein